MRLKSVETTKRIGDLELHVMRFEHDASEVVKYMESGSCEMAVAKDTQAQRVRSFAKHAREAERDFAYMRFGNDWPRHIAQSATSSLVQQAKTLRPDLFGEPDAAASR